MSKRRNINGGDSPRDARHVPSDRGASVLTSGDEQDSRRDSAESPALATQREAHLHVAVPSSPTAVPASAAASIICPAPGCNRSFPTKSGMGVHCNAAHKEWWNSYKLARIEKRPLVSDGPSGLAGDTRPRVSNQRWTDGLLTELARAEWEVKEDLKMGGKDPEKGNEAVINSRLADLLGRSAEAIKRRRNPKQGNYAQIRDKVFETLRGEKEAREASLVDPPAMTDPVALPPPHSAGVDPDESGSLMTLKETVLSCANADPSLSTLTRLVEKAPIQNGALHVHPEEVDRVFADWLELELGVKTELDGDQHTPPKEGTATPSNACASEGEGKQSRKQARRPGRRNAQAESRESAQMPRPQTRHQQRARLRWQSQTDFRRDPFKAGKKALRGEYCRPHDQCDPGEDRAAKVDLPALWEHWGRLFESPSVQDRRSVPAAPPLWDLISPISAAEVGRALRKSKANSPGPDRITKDLLLRVRFETWAVWFNLFMITGHVPSCLTRGIVTLVAKVPNASDASEFRPITVLSKVLRLFHSVMAWRWGNTLRLPQEQRGFREMDGCRDNIWSLVGLIKSSQVESRGLSLAFLDAKNAFGSVSHDSIILALRKLGLPTVLVAYVQNLYSRFQVTFKGDPTGKTFRVKSGVLQGDPLSSVVFNAVMALVCSELETTYGVKLDESGVGQEYTSYLCYADDTVLISREANLLAKQLQLFADSGKLCGLTLNAKKCSSLRIVADRRLKITAVKEEPYFKVNDAQIPALGLRQMYKYLGVQMGSVGINNVPTRSHLQTGLENLDRARINPQQRLFVLRRTLVPQLLHTLVLGGSGLGFLRELDKTIRRYVRKWTHLPHDTPLGAFHAAPRDGGLGIPNLELDVPRFRYWRLQGLENNREQFPLAHFLLGKSFVRSLLLAEKEIKLLGADKNDGKNLLTKPKVAEMWRSKLHDSVDGKGLAAASCSPLSSRWVTELRPVLSGGEFVKCIHTRLAVLKTPVRAARQLRPRPVRLPMCKTCSDRPASLGHLLQGCPRTHGLRIHRHDAVTRLIRQAAQRKGWKVFEEPVIPPVRPPDKPSPTEQHVGSQRCVKGSLKPDLVCVKKKSRQIVVIDPTIIADSVSAEKLHDSSAAKSALYDSERVLEYCRRLAGFDQEEPVSFTVIGLAVTWRGIIDPKALSYLRAKLKLATDLVSLIAVRTLFQSWRMWNCDSNQRTC